MSSCQVFRNNTGQIDKVEAPNGKESKLYQEILKVNPDKEAALKLWAQVYTPSFKQWFGDWERGQGSKVVDENGEPVLMFNGSGINFQEFDKSKLFTGEGAAVYGAGFYFTDNRETAAGYKNITSQMTRLGYEKRRLESLVRSKDMYISDAEEAIRNYNQMNKDYNEAKEKGDDDLASDIMEQMWNYSLDDTVTTQEELDELKKRFENYEKRLAQINYLLENKLNNALVETGFVFDTFLNIKNPIQWEKEASDEFIDKVNSQLQSEKLEKVGKFNVKSASIQQVFRDLAMIFGYNPETRKFEYNEEMGRLFGSVEDHRAAVDQLIKHFSRNPENKTTRVEASGYMNKLLTEVPSPKISEIFDKYTAYTQSLNEKGIFQIKKKEGLTEGQIYNLLTDNLEEPREKSQRGFTNSIHISEFFERIGYDGVLHITKKDFHHPFGNFTQKAGEKHYVAFESNEIKSVFNEGGFSKETKNIYKQTEEMPASKASPETIEKVKKILEKMGVKTKELLDYAKSIGIDVKGVTGLADLTAGIIAIAEGKEDRALVEEMVHIATAIIEQKNPGMITQMISKIDRFEIYKRVLAEYGKKKAYQLENGKPDIRKIKKEAVDKLIAELIIAQNEGDTEFPELRIESERSTIRNWWNSILDWFRGAYKKSNISIFEEAAKTISTGELGARYGQVKEGVSELFESTPELANAVYEALGFVPKMITREGQEYFNNPRIRFFAKIADEVRASLPKIKDGYTRLYRGNRPSDLKSNPQFTNSLEGIALPFLMSYEGQLSYIDIPTSDLPKYVQKGGVATNAEFIVTPEIAKTATSINNTIVEKYKEQYPDRLAPVEVTPQQKQQALQLYSNFLSNFVDNNFDTIIQDLQTKNILDKKCS